MASGGPGRASARHGHVTLESDASGAGVVPSWITAVGTRARGPRSSATDARIGALVCRRYGLTTSFGTSTTRNAETSSSLSAAIAFSAIGRSSMTWP